MNYRIIQTREIYTLRVTIPRGLTLIDVIIRAHLLACMMFVNVEFTWNGDEVFLIDRDIDLTGYLTNIPPERHNERKD